ncbi:uncharacterized protein HD556DRAFT_1428518 [Suillus plorans]|uniref:Uncharacterized protein n=1 Tax=Suillus plorans TaxID=116603 RepID=A0A9P7DYG7_9AGAM|nr:uncharacterized protein HD556DRAFT_1428518 [Suillus plorans]KAG1806383.1 hypothetical protein HD556DRAFT_1428518 [Suillus plorans]
MTHNLFWRRAGPEHTAAAGNAAQPSYCTLPLCHLPMDPNNDQVGLGYISNDGHLFSCRNPMIMQQAFHVSIGGQQAARHDSYNVILFDHSITNALIHDFVSSPDQLLHAILCYEADGGTNFTEAIQWAQSVMEQHWSTERESISSQLPPTRRILAL